MADGNDLPEFARIDDLLDFDEVGMVTQHVADPYDHPFAPCRLGDPYAFGQGLRDGLLQQDVVARFDGLHAGFEVHVFGCGDQHGVGRDGVLEKPVVILETLRGAESEFFGDGAAAERVEFHDADEFQPLGMPDGVFQILVRAVSRADGYDRHGTRTG